MRSRINILIPRVSRKISSPPSRWAQCAAWGAFIATVPSAIWRILLIAGVLPGTTELQAVYTSDLGYVWSLSVVQLATGFLAVGLVRPWGERIFGFEIPCWMPVFIGALGGVAVTVLFTVWLPLSLMTGARPDQGLVHDGPLVLMILCYAPITLWGPLELAAVTAYARRRRM